MKKFKKDKLSKKGKKLTLNRETIKDLTLRTQVAGGRQAPTNAECNPTQMESVCLC